MSLGFVAVMIWIMQRDLHMPRWVWIVILADAIFGAPKMVHDYYMLFSVGHF